MVHISSKAGCNFGIGGHAMSMAAKRLGGNLTVKSYLTTGTEICCEIVLLPEDIVVVAETQTFQLKKTARILLVDDDPLVLEVQKDMLILKASETDLDLEVLTAPGALRGVFVLQTQQIDVLFTDFHMGKQSGLDMIRRYQQTRRDAVSGAPEVKMYLLTGGIDKDTIHEAEELGVKVLLKPLSHSQMVDAINSA
jgi:CheY-like chemotaxis protein